MFDKFTIIFYMKNIVTVRTIFYKFLLMFTNFHKCSRMFDAIHHFLQMFTNLYKSSEISSILTNVHKVHKYL